MKNCYIQKLHNFKEEGGLHNIYSIYKNKIDLEIYEMLSLIKKNVYTTLLKIMNYHEI